MSFGRSAESPRGGMDILVARAGIHGHAHPARIRTARPLQSSVGAAAVRQGDARQAADDPAQAQGDARKVPTWGWSPKVGSQRSAGETPQVGHLTLCLSQFRNALPVNRPNREWEELNSMAKSGESAVFAARAVDAWLSSFPQSLAHTRSGSVPLSGWAARENSDRPIGNFPHERRV